VSLDTWKQGWSNTYTITIVNTETPDEGYELQKGWAESQSKCGEAG
jgi:hypothetical protein